MIVDFPRIFASESHQMSDLSTWQICLVFPPECHFNQSLAPSVLTQVSQDSIGWLAIWMKEFIPYQLSGSRFNLQSQSTPDASHLATSTFSAASRAPALHPFEACIFVRAFDEIFRCNCFLQGSSEFAEASHVSPYEKNGQNSFVLCCL